MSSDAPDAPAAESEHPMMVLMRQIRELSESLDRSEAAAADGGKPYEVEVHAAARELLGSVGKLTVRQVTEVTHHGAYHWVLTVTGTVVGRQALLSDRGVIRPEADETRESICDRLVTDLCAESERTTGTPYLDPKVLFFDLQPNALTDGAP
ncbi:hypothetical protein [Streptomyces sp. IBSBF 2950]|uniref:hypothetical protein n=1 Tax=Streptomyces sp. IBSBF 2950 TaxID=2903528 RepID=UPI002FDBA515